MARVVHVNRERFDVYIGRAMPNRGYPRGSKWQNPNPLPPGFADLPETERQRIGRENLSRYRAHILRTPGLFNALEELRGKVLGCWCHPRACHGDVLVELLVNYGLDQEDKPPQLDLFG